MLRQLLKEDLGARLPCEGVENISALSYPFSIGNASDNRLEKQTLYSHFYASTHLLKLLIHFIRIIVTKNNSFSPMRPTILLNLFFLTLNVYSSKLELIQLLHVLSLGTNFAS